MGKPKPERRRGSSCRRLRINGVEIGTVKVRRKLEDGGPFGPLEVVADVPEIVSGMGPFGEMVLEEDPGCPKFELQVVMDDAPTKAWKAVTLGELTLMLADCG